MLHVLKMRKFYFSIFIVGLYVIVSVINNHIFISETTLLQWYDGILTRVQIQESISIVKKWEWGIIALNIMLVLIKIACIAACLYLGLFFFSNQNNAYTISFNIALKSEIVFVSYYIVRLLWYQFIHIPESIEEFQIMPLSLMSFFDPVAIEPWLVYPLNTLNIFEIFYILMLTALMAVAIHVKFRKAFELVFVSYGAGLLLLMVAQMFLILNNT